jgi:hypothetical protein
MAILRYQSRKLMQVVKGDFKNAFLISCWRMKKTANHYDYWNFLCLLKKTKIDRVWPFRSVIDLVA